eukprot:EG_transcript_28783
MASTMLCGPQSFPYPVQWQPCCLGRDMGIDINKAGKAMKRRAEEAAGGGGGPLSPPVLPSLKRLKTAEGGSAQVASPVVAGSWGCSVCSEFRAQDVYRCVNGVIVCLGCHAEVDRCPCCGPSMSPGPCRMLERVRVPVCCSCHGTPNF